MLIFTIILFTLLVSLILAVIVVYALSAAAEHARKNANSEYEKEAYPMEFGLAYLLFVGISLPGAYVVDKFNLITHSQNTQELMTVGLLGGFVLSYVIVHFICVKIAKRFPNLYKLEWLN